jgi:hypothetical protein
MLNPVKLMNKVMDHTDTVKVLLIGAKYHSHIVQDAASLPSSLVSSTTLILNEFK